MADLKNTASTIRATMHAQSNALHDVQVLLDAIRVQLEELETDDDIDPLYRLATMAKERVSGALHAFSAHI